MDPEMVGAEEQQEVRHSNRKHLIGLALAFIVFGVVPVVLMIVDYVQR